MARLDTILCTHQDHLESFLEESYFFCPELDWRRNRLDLKIRSWLRRRLFRLFNIKKKRSGRLVDPGCWSTSFYFTKVPFTWRSSREIAFIGWLVKLIEHVKKKSSFVPSSPFMFQVDESMKDSDEKWINNTEVSNNGWICTRKNAWTVFQFETYFFFISILQYLYAQHDETDLIRGFKVVG